MNSIDWNRACRPSILIPAVTRMLADGGIDSPAAEAQLLVGELISGEPILAPALEPAAMQRLRAMVEERLSGRPLQHILGWMQCGPLTLQCDERALVVRPETELLVAEGVLELAALPAVQRQAVDLCTGSGAIALAMAAQVPHARVVAVDCDAQALCLARENLARYRTLLDDMGSQVEFIQADVRALPPGISGNLLVANPPYLPAGEQLPREVCHDPALALYGGGEDGLDLPRACVQAAATIIAPGGRVLIEHHDDQGPGMRQAAVAAGMDDVHTLADLAGRDRFLSARVGVQQGSDSGRIEA